MYMATQELHPSNQQQPAFVPAAQTVRGKRGFERFAYRTGEFLTDHWASIITWGLGLLVFTAIAIPFLSFFGLEDLSKQLFYSLHYVCAQVPSHSFYIFGHQ